MPKPSSYKVVDIPRVCKYCRHRETFPTYYVGTEWCELHKFGVQYCGTCDDWEVDE